MHDDGHFGEEIASGYDDPMDVMNTAAAIDPAVDCLVDLAAGGRALELAIGTGRIGLPLSRRGVEVHGIELSRAMVERLRAKPGADAIEVAIGDMTSTRVDGSFSLVYLVYNTICNLTTQAGQVACFRNAAAHLAPGGCFVIEVGVPDLQRLPKGESFLVFDFGERHIGIDEYDVVNQGLVSHHYDVRGEEIRGSSGPFRYVWPSELDLMAGMAGLRLRHRWADWGRQPFTKLSDKHVSVWEKPASDSVGGDA
jgi:SAM-dependent methyltransferase